MLLFSIPVHENQDIINNHVENIFNYNPDSKIILHVNKKFNDFDPLKTNYQNVYINATRLDYIYGNGLLWIHINNFFEAIRLNLDFQYFCIISSNEMFIKHGLIDYIIENKNGLQLVEYNPNIKWHLFQRGLHNNEVIINLLKKLGLEKICGGQAEGQFYEKHIFQKIVDLYPNSDISYFETEEIITQTIFKSLNISYGLPFTLQNYSNNISYDEKFIEDIRKNDILIPNMVKENTLWSAHVNRNSSYAVYSIKRIDRDFNSLRNYISRKGFIINKEEFRLNTYYYSNTSKLYMSSLNSFIFHTKKNKYYNWFAYELDKGTYLCRFQIRVDRIINNYENIGIKINYPIQILYNQWISQLCPNEWITVSVNIEMFEKQYLFFLFDNYEEDLDMEFRNIEFIKNSYLEDLDDLEDLDEFKENIVVYLKSDGIDTMCYNNIYNMVIKPLTDIYKIYLFFSVSSNVMNLTDIVNLHPVQKIYLNNMSADISDISDIMNFFNKKMLKFLVYINLGIIFEKSIKEFNFFVNKINFLYYSIPYIDDKICNNTDFITIPYRYLDGISFDKFLYNRLKTIGGLPANDFNFMIDDNYYDNISNNIIKYYNNNNYKNTQGYPFDKKYNYYMFYKNKYSKFLKTYDNEFYFYKKRTKEYHDWLWTGLYVNKMDDVGDIRNITVSFDIKLLKKINVSGDNYGIKIHAPLSYQNDWINLCNLNIYTHVDIHIQIKNISQYILLNFDNYLDKVEFYIKKFQIKFSK